MKKLLLFALLSLAFNASAQFTQEWIRTDDSLTNGTSVAVDANDNAFVTMHDGSIRLRKYDIDGNLEWEVQDTTGAQFNYQFPSRVHIDPQGNALVVGYRYTLPSTSSNTGHIANAIVILKYEADGDFVYKKTYTGAFSTLNNSHYWTKVSSEMDADGYLYLGTAGLLDGYPNHNFKAIKLNPAGDIVWVASHAYATFFYYMNNIRLHGDKLGLIGTTNSANANVAVWQIDTTGADVYNDILIGVGGKDIAFDNGGNMYALSWISTSFVGDVALYKFDPSGDTLWLKTYDFGHSELASRIEFTPDNHLAIMAYGNQQPDSWYSDWITFNVDLDGNLQWSKRYDQHENNDEIPQDIAVDEFSNVYVTGVGGPFPGGSNLGLRQMVTIKYNADGDSIWFAAIDTFTEFNTGVDIALDSEDGMYVLGSDFSILVRYNDTTNTGVGINDVIEANGVVVFPNPANKIVNVASTNDIIRFEAFDVTGKSIYSNNVANAKQTSIDVNGWHNGVYLFKLTYVDGQRGWWKFIKG